MARISVLDWVPYSPDLNPIEHLWDYVDCQAVQEEWAKIPLEVLHNLILSMFAQVKAILKAKDWHFKY
ncbi:35578_t:CDS:2 [Racocetra persica]|uniref:35578_t:CDS:1 n=1 Tax=Racocetra persica TaxID=160502 RepID=A0ACA9KI52_9GLOM|nr:35578_t:CDS:2 [Racocetra persica]